MDSKSKALRLMKVSLSGFGSYGDEAQTIDFNGGGSVAVIGDNGAGKSTLISKSLSWCLYGKSAPDRMGTSTRTLSGKHIMNKACSKTAVCVELGNDYERYVINRSRVGSSSDELEIIRYNGKKESERLDPTNTTIEGIVGVDWFTFTRTVLRAQGDPWSFAEATDKNKRELLDVVSGAFILSEAEKRARVSQKATDMKTKQEQMRVDIVNQKLNSLKIENYAMQEREWDISHREKIQKAKAELATAIQVENQAMLDDAELDTRKEMYDALIEAKPTIDNVPFKEAVTNAESLYSVAFANVQQAKKEVSVLEGLGEGDNCPTCGQVVSIDAPILSQKVAAVKKEEEESLKLKLYENYKSECYDALKEAEDWLESQLTEWQSKLSQFGSIPARQHGGAVRYRAEIENRIETLTSTKNPYTVALEREQEQKEELTEELSSSTALLSTLSSDAALASVWVNVLGPKGVRAQLAEAALGAIELASNEWLSVLSGGRMLVQFPSTRDVKGELKEEIKTIVSSRSADGKVESRDLLTFSGGERRRINLAVDLGVASAFTKNELSLSLLILDEEVFSGLDEEGKAGVIHALHGSGIHNVIVIDHDPRLAAKLDRTIKVVRDANGHSQVLEL